MKYVLTIFVLSAASFAVTATQTDWSGGSGVPGPVTNWGTSYDISNNVDVSGAELKLTNGLLATPFLHHVNTSNLFYGATSAYATDVDGDGDMDVLGAAKVGDKIIWWENTDGIGTSWTEHLVREEFDGACSVYATDVDGDGDTDVLGAACFADEITWWENTDGVGTSWTEHTVDYFFDNACSVFATDVDGDGDVDVLGAASSASDITWWENTDGTGTLWIEHTVDDSFYAATSVYATDVDGDGDVDILGASGSDDIAWWENIDGSGTSWAEHAVDGDFDAANSVYAADVDGDGDTDILGAALYGDDITWWENTDGSGTSWTEHTVDGEFDGAASVFATDVDGDGDVDVLGAAFIADEITWWENLDGAGTSWIEHVVAVGVMANGASSVYATDVDGDGDVDVLGAIFQTNRISWWDVMGYTTSGATLESSILHVDSVNYWDNFVFSGDAPLYTTLAFQFRSSQDSSSMGDWSAYVFSSTSLSGILADSTDFLQYRVILQTNNPQDTPVLNDLLFTYTSYVGVVDDNADVIVFWGLTTGANPSYGNFAVQVSVPQPGMVDMVLYDITGRVIAQYSQELSGGTHEVSFSNLAEGVYFCTMHAGDFTAAERVVVLK